MKTSMGEFMETDMSEKNFDNIVSEIRKAIKRKIEVFVINGNRYILQFDLKQKVLTMRDDIYPQDEPIVMSIQLFLKEINIYNRQVEDLLN